MPSLQPIAEDRLEPEDRGLRQASAMITPLPLTLLAPDSSDAPQILVTRMALGSCVCAPPYLRAAPVERVVAFPLVVSVVGADLFDLSVQVLK
jgi:hypothetical protein